MQQNMNRPDVRGRSDIVDGVMSIRTVSNNIAVQSLIAYH